MSGTARTTARTTGELKTYRMSLHVEQTIHAEDEEEALWIFWDDLMRSQADEENATVEEA